MKYEELDQIYNIGIFQAGSLFKKAFQYLQKDRARCVILFFPYLFYTIASSLVNNLSENMSSGSYFLLFIVTHVIGLFVSAYYIFSLDSRRGHPFDGERAAAAWRKVFPLIKTELAMFLFVLPIVFATMLLGGVAAVFIGVENIESSVYWIVGIMVLPIFVYIIRFLLATYITVVHRSEGISALRLSVMVYKKNRKAMILLSLVYYLSVGLLIIIGFAALNNPLWINGLSLFSAVFSFFYMVVFTHITESALTLKQSSSQGEEQ